MAQSKTDKALAAFTALDTDEKIEAYKEFGAILKQEVSDQQEKLQSKISALGAVLANIPE